MLYNRPMTAVERIFERALELTPDERLELAELLLESSVEPFPGWWESVKPEMDRRLAAVDAGESKTLSWAEVRKRMYERLNARPD